METGRFQRVAAAIFFCVQNQRNAQQIPPFGGGILSLFLSIIKDSV